MKNKIGAAVVIGAIFGIHSAGYAQTADVVHYWTSSGESKAMNALADAFKAAGGKWVDSATANFDDGDEG